MTSSAHKIVKAIVVVAASAGFAVPTAVAASPDAFQRAVNIHNAATSYPDAFGRAVNIHNAAVNLHDEALGGASQVDTALGIQSTPVHDEALGGASQVDRALGISATPSHDEAIGGVSQLNRALGITQTGAPVTRVVVQSGGFDWGDAGIGAGGELGLVFLLGTAGSLVLRQKQRLSNA